MAGVLKLAIALVAVSGAVVSGRNFVNFMSIQMTEAERLHAQPNLPDLIKKEGLSDLYEKLKEENLIETLAMKDGLTVFGPTNEAFSKIPDWLKKVLSSNATLLTYVLEYHVLPKIVTSKDIKDEAQEKSLVEKPIRFNIYPDGKVTSQCAPINLKKVDLKASNGYLHELQSVMLPPSGNIVEAAVACPAFKTLVTALKAADLVDTLAGDGPYTVFAPTDAAFKKIDPQVLDNLLKNKTALQNVLEYHVTKRTYCSVGLVQYKELEMLNKQKVKIAVVDGKVKVNSATVLPGGADGSVTNGVVHAIDTVLGLSSLQTHP